MHHLQLASIVDIGSCKGVFKVGIGSVYSLAIRLYKGKFFLVLYCLLWVTFLCTTDIFCD